MYLLEVVAALGDCIPLVHNYLEYCYSMGYPTTQAFVLTFLLLAFPNHIYICDALASVSKSSRTKKDGFSQHWNNNKDPTDDNSIIITQAILKDLHPHPHHLEQETSRFPHDKKTPPYLATITTRNACDSATNLEQACWALEQTLQTSKVDLVVVRCTPTTADPDLVLELIQHLVEVVEDHDTAIIVHQDWWRHAIKAQAHGIHIKEDHWDVCAEIKNAYLEAQLPPPLLGATSHSLESALQAMAFMKQVDISDSAESDAQTPSQRQQLSLPHMGWDYLFVGSCYFSGASHPEKTILEGPGLPGRVVAALQQHEPKVPVFAIGGIEAENCREPIQLGAHGVTVLRSVLQSEDPAQSLTDIWSQLHTKS